MIELAFLTMINFNDAAKYYKELPHQVDAFSWLQECCSDEVITEFGRLYRNAPETNEFTNDWASVQRLANAAGAKYPELVAAQWALESGWGQHVSGKNNFFGIKGKGTVQKTWEDYGNGPVDIFDEFKDFDTPFDCIDELVTKWYKDYNGYTGANVAKNRDQAAYHLKHEGYATDPVYPQKLISLMNKYA